MKDELPPPVTKDSSKADLWEELQSVLNENRQLQQSLTDLKGRAHAMEVELVTTRYQLSIINSVLAPYFKAMEKKDA